MTKKPLVDEESRARDLLAQHLGAVLSGLDGTQAEIGRLVGLDQAEVSALRRGIYRRFSIERLLRSLRQLGWNIDISLVLPSARDLAPGRVLVRAKSPRRRRNTRDSVTLT